MTYRLGIDVGGTKIALGVVRVEGDDVALLAEKTLAVSRVGDLFGVLRNAVESLCRECGIPYSALLSCGVGVPGTVSEDGRRVVKAPNLPLLEGDFADGLSAALGLPVSMVQDSRAAAWGEYRAGGGRGAKTLICMTLGTGIGTGLVLDGHIYHGALGSAGELGHIPARPNGRPCGCGKRGCLEKYCAGGGLDLTAAELFGAGKTARTLFEEARKGNDAARAAIDSAVSLLGNAVVAAINLLSPSCVLFSGGLSEEEDYLRPLIDYVRAHTYSSAGELPRIEKAALGARAPLIGAALYER